MFLLNSAVKSFKGKAKWLPLTALSAGFFVLIITFLPLPAVAGIGSFLASNIILPIAGLIGKLVLVFIDMLINIVQYNDFINAPAVVRGWVIVRDVCNMFFIVVLLMLAFGTIFKIEEYQYNRYLGKLLIMAVLVNFSKGITGFFIDFAQVIMLTFVNGFKEAAAGNFINGFHLDKMFTFSTNSSNLDDVKNNEAVFFQSALLALISMLISLVVIGVYLVIFLLRIVALWFLTIVSPFAYLLAAAPGGASKYASEWWDYFTKYAITGPILAFFLWLSLAVMQFSSNALGTAGQVNSDQMPSAAITLIGSSDVLLSFIINIVLLLGGLWMAQRLGVAGGGLAGSALSKIKSAGTAPFRGLAKGAAWLGSKGWKNLKEGMGYQLNKRLPPWANIAARIKARRLNLDQVYHGAEAIAVGKARQARKDSYGIPYESIARRGIEAEHAKEFSHMTKEQKAALYKTVDLRLQEKPNDFKAHEIRNALLMNAASVSHNDDILVSDYMRNKKEWHDKDGIKHNGFAIKMEPVYKDVESEEFDENGNVVKDEKGETKKHAVKMLVGYKAATETFKINGQDKNIKKRGALTEEEKAKGYIQAVHNHEIVHDFFGSLSHGKDDEDSANFVYNLGEAARAAKHWQMFEHSGRDDATGKMMKRELDDAQKQALIEFFKVNTQEGAGSPPHPLNTMYMGMDEQVFYGKGDDGFENKIRETLTRNPSLEPVSRYHQPRTIKSLFGGITNQERNMLEVSTEIIATSTLKADVENHMHNIQQLVDKTNTDGFFVKGGYIIKNGKLETEGEGTTFDSLADFIEAKIFDKQRVPIKESWDHSDNIYKNIEEGRKVGSFKVKRV